MALTSGFLIAPAFRVRCQSLEDIFVLKLTSLSPRSSMVAHCHITTRCIDQGPRFIYDDSVAINSTKLPYLLPPSSPTAHCPCCHCYIHRDLGFPERQLVEQSCARTRNSYMVSESPLPALEPLGNQMSSLQRKYKNHTWFPIACKTMHPSVPNPPSFADKAMQGPATLAIAWEANIMLALPRTAT